MGYEQKATERRSQGIYDLVLRLKGKIDEREDSYWFLFFYNSVDNTCSIEGCTIVRHAIPDSVKSEVLRIGKTNNKVTEFLKKYPNPIEYFEWYSSKDENCNPQIKYISELEIWPSESNVVRVHLSAPGIWIPEEHPGINFYVGLANEKVLFYSPKK